MTLNPESVRESEIKVIEERHERSAVHSLKGDMKEEE
jgi:hypothetical protein